MAFGFPASYSETRSFAFHPEDLSSIIESVLDDLGWRHEVLTNNEFSASVPINMASWGEDINVLILPNGSVAAESKCTYPMQCFDWGKNKENVERFFDRMETLKGWQVQATVGGGGGKIPAAFDERGFSPVERIFSQADDE